MKLKKTKPKIYATTMSLAVAAGVAAGVSGYRSGTQFEPTGSSREIRENRVSFSDESSKTNQGNDEQQDNSALWEKDESAQDQSTLDEAQNAAYLFEQAQNQLENGQTTMNVAQTNDQQVPDAAGTKENSRQNENEPVYDITDKKADADTVIKNQPGNSSDQKGNGQSGNGKDNTVPKPGAGDADGKNDGNADGNGNGSTDENGGHSGDSNKDQNSQGGNDSDHSGNNGQQSKDDKEDPDKKPEKPAKPSTPASTARDPVIASKPDNISGLANSNREYQEDIVTSDAVSEWIVIEQRWSDDIVLYKGQSVSEQMLFFALDTYVLDQNSLTAYLWSEAHYGKYIKIDGVSFDRGNSWITQYPITIPEDIEEGNMVIRVTYRLSQKDEWTEKLVAYEPKNPRFFVLSKRLEKENEEINPDNILNWDQYPDPGSTINLMGMTSNLLGGEQLTGLFPGWMEDGTIVPWFYTITPGRHILEPAELVPLDETYVVSIKEWWVTPEGKVDDTAWPAAYCGLQALTDLNIEEVDWKKYTKILNVPQYIQAISLDWGVQIETDRLQIPETVIYIENQNTQLRVNESYEVSANNPNYASEDGILYNKEKTEMIGVPYERTKLDVAQNIEKVDLALENRIRELHLEADTMEQIPEIAFQSLNDCGIMVKPEMLDPFLEQYGEDLTANGNYVMSEADPNKKYTMSNSLVTDQNRELYRVLGYKGKSLRIPSDITAIDAGAFQKAEQIQTLIWPEDAEIELKPGCFGGSNVKKIICRSNEQLTKLAEQLKGTGIEVVLSKKTKDGFSYSSEAVDGNIVTTLMEAPKDVTEFDGMIQEEGEMIAVNEIEANAFAGCANLTWVILPKETYSIGYQAFRNCTALEGVFIDNRESITIGDEAFQGCGALRFIASNARTGVMENDYDPAVHNLENYDGRAQMDYFFVPEEASGYGVNAVYPKGTAGIDHYELRAAGANGKILYGVDEQGNAVAVLRSGNLLDTQVILPSGVSTIYAYAFSGSKSESEEGYQINWGDLTNLTSIYEGAFVSSDLSGNVECGTTDSDGSIVIGNYAFTYCTKLKTVTIRNMLLDLGSDIFVGDSALKTVQFSDMMPGMSFYAGMFNDCDQLESLTFGTVTPMQLVTYIGMKCQFNYSWTPEKEAEKLRLIVPEGSQMDYLMNWRYRFVGSTGYYSDCPYLDLWTKIWNDLWYAGYPIEPSNEDVDAQTLEELLNAENRLRKMLRMETVAVPTDLYQVRQVGNYLTLLGVPVDKTDISLDAATLDFPEGWYLDAIGSGAFSGADNLSSVTVQNNLVEIESGAFRGAASGSGSMTLNIKNCGTEDAHIIALKGFSESDPFTFGIDDAKLRIKVPEGEESEYIKSWTYPLVGYQNATELEAAVREKLTESGSTDQELTGKEPDQTETDLQEKIEQEMVKILLPAENRLRRMMELNEAKDAEELYCYDFVSNRAAEASEAESEELTEEQSEQDVTEASSDTETETEETETETEKQTEPETETEKQTEPETETETESEKQSETEKMTESKNTEASDETELREETESQNTEAEIRQETEFEVIL